MNASPAPVPATPRPGRVAEVMALIRARIATRAYVPGTRLPSVRALAQAVGCSVSTVVQAYERLAADGIIRSRPGSGFYVCGPTAPLTLAELGAPLEREVDPLWISRFSLQTGAPTLKPGCGWLPPDWMFEAGMRRALRASARADAATLTDYATPQGLPALRQWLARRLSATGIECPPEQIMLSESGTQAIDLICRYFVEPGDTVLVDDPCYFNFHALLRAHRVRVVGVPYTPSGPDLAAFETALREHAPRLYITNAGIHNPTGATLSAAIAHRLLMLAEQARLVIVEDDIFADFETEAAPRLAAFDGLARVLSIGSHAKSISASLRCGYIAARPEWIDALVDLKIATSFGGGHLASVVLHSVLSDSGYRKHMDGVRLRLAGAMDRMLGRLGKLGIEAWQVPRAGMFAWCRLPPGADAAALARSGLAQGVVLAPGNAFSQSPQAGHYLRFNAAQSQDARIFEFLRRALEA